MAIFECLEFLKNVTEKLLSFGMLPDNAPEIELRGYMYDKEKQRLVLTITTRNHSAIFSKVVSKNYELLKVPLRIDQKVSIGDDADILLPVKSDFEKNKEIDFELYYQDMQNRMYVANMRINPQEMLFSLLKTRRAFRK